MSIPNALMIILGLEKNKLCEHISFRKKMAKLQKVLDNSKKNSVAKSTKNLVIPYQCFSKKNQNKLGTYLLILLSFFPTLEQ